jgi:hypothetical protein
MRHPSVQPKYRINQQVKAPFCDVPVVIKSIRYRGESEYRNNRQKFIAKGWEYEVYYYSQAYECWEQWGWLTEKNLDNVND